MRLRLLFPVVGILAPSFWSLASGASDPPSSEDIKSVISKFEANGFREYYYLERTASSTGEDETIVMLDDQKNVFITHNAGKQWDLPDQLREEQIVEVYPHPYCNDCIYFVTTGTKVFYSIDRGRNIRSFDAPAERTRDRLRTLAFHPTHHDWMIWTGAKDCNNMRLHCHSNAWISKDRGDHWETLLRYVKKCEFVAREDRPGSKDLIYCEKFEHEENLPDNPLQLLASNDFFATEELKFPDILQFATMQEFIIVAARATDKHSLKLDASVDGHIFADAQFPANFQVDHQQAYTVLDSSTHAIFLHVTVNTLEDYEYGSIIKSNSNGTSYVLSISGVNRNVPGYVDFEKMQGLEGVAVVNIVDNLEEANVGKAKKLKTMITHNDGAEWQLLSPPEKDAQGKEYECEGGLEKCSLNLHGYTERKDPRNTYSSPSAVGLMMGVGNVGEYLGRYKNGDTFITRDGGITWHAVMKGTYMWEYGDQGSIIVIVEENSPTDHIFYSLDEGENWLEYQFSRNMMTIFDITTVPSDSSRNFILWGNYGRNVVTVAIDFTGLKQRQDKCVLNKEDPEANDYSLWTPTHPTQKNGCLFGHVSQYYRKKIESECFNGALTESLHMKLDNCPCERQDFEWQVTFHPTKHDFNYQRAIDGSCQLVEGLEPADHSQICRDDPSQVQYREPNGYRRIPLTTCVGGRQLDESKEIPCPGHKEEFEKSHGISGIGLFFAITLPVLAAFGVGYWVWINWDGKFGRIRLGDGTSTFNSDSPFISYPIAAIAAIIAVLGAIPLLVLSLGRSLWGGRSKTYTTRSSFARGTSDYAAVDNDEGELLGDDSDEEV
ncbi:MAG: vacuolar protein sorting/targeting protein PEP1 [Trizodia sp. TS-e1964]|nr:MAG: vacuolar protein sorting/targeting protein PEP1 [Trizodia sp. TS-e1964]